MGCEHTELGELYKYMVAPPPASSSTDPTPAGSTSTGSTSAATDPPAPVPGLVSALAPTPVPVPVPSVPIRMAAGFEQYASDTGGQLHDAGWDAYVTGHTRSHTPSHTPPHTTLTRTPLTLTSLIQPPLHSLSLFSQTLSPTLSLTLSHTPVTSQGRFSTSKRAPSALWTHW